MSPMTHSSPTGPYLYPLLLVTWPHDGPSFQHMTFQGTYSKQMCAVPSPLYSCDINEIIFTAVNSMSLLLGSPTKGHPTQWVNWWDCLIWEFLPLNIGWINLFLYKSVQHWKVYYSNRTQTKTATNTIRQNKVKAQFPWPKTDCW